MFKLVQGLQSLDDMSFYLLRKSYSSWKEKDINNEMFNKQWNVKKIQQSAGLFKIEDAGNVSIDQ